MRTVSDLARKLHRQPWAVIKMLKSRGYLKRNGEPKVRMISSGYMTSHGLIKKAGWDFFIEKLGKKDSCVKKRNNVKN